MSSQNIRFFLLAAILVVGMLLFNTWQSENNEKNKAQSIALETKEKEKETLAKDIPQITELPKTAEETTAPEKKGKLIHVKTDVLELDIDSDGGDIVYLALPAYPEGKVGEAAKQPFILFDHSKSRYYIAQSGLTGPMGPDMRGVGRAQYQTDQYNYQLKDNENRLVVDLNTKTNEDVYVTKRFIFHRDQYAIDLEYIIDNRGSKEYKGSFYGQLKRKPEASEGGGLFGIQTYTGAAVHTENTPFKKLSFKDIDDKPFSETIKGGWAAMVEHYFVSAWIPEPDVTYTYQTIALPDGSKSIGFISPMTTIEPNKQDNFEAKLYAGPEITDNLNKLGPGLDLSVDYGVLWPICKPIFWLLKQIYDWVGNWGWSIVIITIIIKLLFYKLSAQSYRSMGNMRKLQPKIELLKERYGDDKQKFSQAVMELYRKEKVNPLGGCLPIVVQIPVFIALYYVLLGSVELRQAHFMLWITDLSAKDPYYVLPILMGLSMLIQQKLNPPPPDPMQAKMMMFMPVIFTVLFLNFPSGLVLYWLVNNVLSIIQQWYITRTIGKKEVVPGKT